MPRNKPRKGSLPINSQAEQVKHLINRRQFLYMTGGAISVILLPACGGGGGGAGGGGGTPPIEEDFFRATNVVLKDNVIPLADDGSVTASELTPTGLRLSGQIPAIAAGSVITGGFGSGLMRRVITATQDGADLVLETEDASIEDVFEEAEIEFRRTMAPSDVDEIQTHLAGVQVNPSSRAVTETLSIDVPKTFVGIGTDQARVGAELTASGSLSVALTGSIRVQSPFGLTRLTLGAAAVMSGEYAASVYGKAQVKKEIPYVTVIYFPLPLGLAGPVPIFLLPVLSLQLSVSGTMIAGWEISGSGNANYSAGLLYQQVPLGGGFSLSNITAVGTGSYTGQSTGPNMYGTIKLEINPIQAELATSFNGLVGPTMRVDIPVFAGEIKANDATGIVDMSVDAVFRGKVGAKAGLLGLSWPLWEVTVGEQKLNIWKKSWEPGNGEVVVK